MSATASTLPKRAKPAAKRKPRKKKAGGWLPWWPLLLGILVTPFAVKAATVMALTGPDGLRVLYPWMLLPKLHLFGLGDPVADAISEGMMYLQFPLYGLLGVISLRRNGGGGWKGATSAMVQIGILHLVALGLLFVAGHG